MHVVEAHGARIPTIGLGTMTLKDDVCVQAVKTALQVGYRHLDTAAFYGNEVENGAGGPDPRPAHGAFDGLDEVSPGHAVVVERGVGRDEPGFDPELARDVDDRPRRRRRLDAPESRELLDRHRAPVHVHSAGRAERRLG